MGNTRPAQPWDGDDRRKTIDPIAELREHIDARCDRLEDLYKSGFPGGDPEAHRRVHEGYIKDAKTRADLREAVIKQILTGAVWGTLVLLAGLAWTAFKAEVKK